jgi:uncharacterized protein involved in exopolysaccharide biosynthesis
MTEERIVELGAVWDRVRTRLRTIALVVGAATALTAGVAMLLPQWYRATASLLPPSEEESGFGIANLLKGIGVPGVKVPTQATPADVFVAVLSSRRVNEEVVRRFELQKRYRRKLMEDALRELRRHAGFSVNEAGVISIAVEDRDPKRAADMANAYVEILDRFNRDVRMTKGRRTRAFVEQRLAETRGELQTAEQRLAAYQARHKTLPLSPEMASSVESAARLYAERSALQVRLAVAESYSRGASAETAPLREQMAAIDRQLQAMPATGLDAARLLRDVKTLEALFVLLTGQREEARINEARNVATVEVLDPATPPERRARPKRGLMVAGAFAASLMLAVAWAAVQADRPAARG